MYLLEYERWLNSNELNQNEKQILQAMSDVEKQDAFYTNITFGTAGMRGLLGLGTNRMNIYTVRKATLGYIQYIKAKAQETRGIAIGYDNRHMSYEFAIDVAKLLASYQIKSYLYQTLHPTPMVSFAVRHFDCFGGLMITASHNPKEYNGYKLYNEYGGQLALAEASSVSAYIDHIEDELAIVTDEDVNASYIHFIDKDVDILYYQNVLNIQFFKHHSRNLRIVFSPQHGTANKPVQDILNQAGYQVIPVLEQCDPDPNFSNTKTPNPEAKEAYELALEYAQKHHADLVLVCDPDADRMGVASLHQGTYQLLTGNQSGAILAHYIFTMLEKEHKMPKDPIMFNTIVTSSLGDDIASYHHVKSEKTLTGFKFIAEKIHQYEQNKSYNYVFGYEESYGSLIAPFVRDKDAMQACLMLSEAADFYKQHHKTLIDVLIELYEQYGYYEDFQESLEFIGAKGSAKMQEMLAYIQQHPFQEINNQMVQRFEDYQKQIYIEDNKQYELVGFASSEVFKFYLEDGSWIAIRPSGTEPKCKIYYCIKGKSKHEVLHKKELYQQVMQAKLARWKVE